MPKKRLHSNLILGDAFEVIPTIKDKVALIITDPPYEVSTDGGGGSINRVKKIKRLFKGFES